MELSCHCGSVTLCVQRRPDFIHECNCSLCMKTGAIWGYFDPREVRVNGSTLGYRRADKAEPGAIIRFCGTCGATSHFELSEAAVEKFGNAVVGVNMRLADERELSGVEMRYPDGRAWPGSGDFGYVRPPRVID
ncbi:GFA family protein [Sandaracinobacteroides saxicola]|uniref:GFA family protein n=1 Tax=Sandaracinobacteroides saxicola TaxID=2759707 RepID=UPI001FB19541|nr:aldehyde-activating protein [Sandaracinobacteroides saxicola]